MVTVENELSERGQITSGVHQGSIIGPLLFVLLMNDLPDCLTTCKTLMYADDTVIYCSSKNVHHIETVLTRELGLINNWLKDKSLFLNKTKTECVLFGSRQRLSDVPTFTVSIDGFHIKHSTKYTYLGLVLEQTLSWNEHVTHLIGKAAKKVRVLSRIRQNITTNTANTVYKSFILPVLEYRVDMLWQIQCQLLREITKESSPDYYDKAQIVEGKAPHSFSNYFKSNYDISKRITRQQHHLHLPKFRTECGKNSFKYHGCVIFNKFQTR